MVSDIIRKKINYLYVIVHLIIVYRPIKCLHQMQSAK